MVVEMQMQNEERRHKWYFIYFCWLILIFCFWILTKYFKSIGSSFSLASSPFGVFLLPFASFPPTSMFGKASSFCVKEKNDMKRKNESKNEIKIRGGTVFLPCVLVLWKDLYKLLRIIAECGKDGHLGKKVYHCKFQSWHMIKDSHLLYLHISPPSGLYPHKCK